jgi:hypothetical protein
MVPRPPGLDFIGWFALWRCAHVIEFQGYRMSFVRHPSGLHAFVSQGKNTGQLLFPHRYKDGRFVVSMTRFERDYVRISGVDELLRRLEAGYSLRMSNPEAGITAPSLVEPEKIYRPVV